MSNNSWLDYKKEHERKYRRENYEQNRDRDLARQKEYKAENKERIRQKNKEYWASEAGKGVNRFHRSNRRFMESRAKPSWANNERIKDLHDLAILLTEETGLLHEVDHIVPMKSDIVSGLHWEGNMQVVTWYENRSKKNCYWPDMPDWSE